MVISIISLLVAILLPSLSGAKELAQRMQCQTLLRQFALSNEMYANEYDGWYVPITQWWTSPDAGGLTQIHWFQSRLFRELMEVTLMPEDTPNSGVWPAQYLCPNATFAYESITEEARQYGGHIGRSYGFNREQAFEKPRPSGSWPPIYLGHSTERVVNPSMKFQMMDGMDWFVGPASRAIHYIGETIQPYNATPALRHPAIEGLNASCFDGHAEYVPFEQVVEDDHWNVTGDEP